MRKKIYKEFLILCLFLGVLSLSIFSVENKKRQVEVSMEALSDQLVIPGGMPVGIYMETDGVMVLGTETIKTENGKTCNPAGRLIKKGDYIVAFDNEKIINKKQLIDKLETISEKEVLLKLRRSDDILNVKLEPAICKNGKRKLGIWIRDNTQGLGTITFITKNSRYGALGHGIHDVDTGELLNLSTGKLYKTSIKDIKKGTNGEPGGMEGIIIYNRHNIIGSVDYNSDAGIFGHLDKPDDNMLNQKPVSILPKEKVKKGNAIVRCCVDGSIKDYNIKITKINKSNCGVNKGFEIEVIDSKLLDVTGGIVQGMSGSPVIQNGRIVGAVTHVLVNDPTRGYGIFIENMLEAAE